MFEPKDIIYVYDGTFMGLLCCVFESFQSHETPSDVIAQEAWQPALFDTKMIATDLEKATRVENWIYTKLSAKARTVFQQAYLAVFAQKELHLLQYMQLCHTHGSKAPDMLQNPSVLALNKALVTLGRESEKWLGLLRFSDYNGVLVAIIDPTSYVLPMLQSHFCDRYSTERFFIFDETHKVGLVSEYGAGKLVEIEDFTLPETTEDERMFQALWKQFFKTIAIKERTNPKLQQHFVPNRYRTHLTELQKKALDGTDAPSLSPFDENVC